MSTTPSPTPNVVIENPTVRRRVRQVIDAIGGVIFIVVAADAASVAFDLLPVTTPAMAAWIAARAVFGFGVDSPNTPSA